MTAARSHRFTTTTFFIWSGLLIWMGNFVFLYVFAALACARRFAEVRVLGVAVVPFTTLVSCLLAIAATGTMMWIAYRRIPGRPPAGEQSTFIRFIVMAASLLALIGTLYVLLPPLLLATNCEGGA